MRQTAGRSCSPFLPVFSLLLHVSELSARHTLPPPQGHYTVIAARGPTGDAIVVSAHLLACTAHIKSDMQQVDSPQGFGWMLFRSTQLPVMQILILISRNDKHPLVQTISCTTESEVLLSPSCRIFLYSNPCFHTETIKKKPTRLIFFISFHYHQG